MRLNNDCVRDILFSVEDNTGYNLQLCYPIEKEKCPKLNKYNDDEVMYHLIQCEKSNLIECSQLDLSGNLIIKDLTPRGHEYLNNIRKDTNWSKVKKISKSVGAESLKVMEDIAVGVITNVINSQIK